MLQRWWQRRSEFWTDGHGVPTVLLLLALVQFLTLPALRHYASAILFHKLPVPNAERIFTVSEIRWNGSRTGVSEKGLKRWLDRAQGDEELATYSLWDYSYHSDHGTSSVVAARVSERFFPLLGVPVALGQPLQPKDFVKGAPKAALISHEFWQERFDSDPHIIDRQIRLSGSSYVVRGVLPPRFWFLSRKPSVWVPVDLVTQTRETNPRDINALVRLRPGLSYEAFEQQLMHLDEQDNPEIRILRYRRKVSVVPLYRSMQSDLGLAFWMLTLPFGTMLISSGLLISRQVSVGRDPVTLAPYILFLIGKVFALCLALVAVWVVWQDVTATLGVNFAAAVVLQLTQAIGYFFICLKLAHWCARDQKLRCRVCLARMRMPVSSGTRNSVLLDRSGDEFICPEGHGQLYVPDQTPADEGEPKWTPSRGIWEELLAFRKQ